MKTSILACILALIFSAMPLCSQDLKVDEKEYAEKVEIAPEIVGGIIQLSKNIVYPEKAKEQGVVGQVFVEVFLSETGGIDDLRAMKTDSELLTEAALSAVRKTRFTPGKVDGAPVKTKLVIPIKFALH